MESNDSFVSDICNLYRDKKWEDIIDRYHNVEDRNKLLWVFPSRDNLNFIKKTMQNLKIDELLSIGCGSGLLEWIISEALGVKVLGIEVDDAWWSCKYAPPTFMPLHIAKTCLKDDFNTKKVLENNKAALMFCYFNNRKAFVDYLDNFKGNVLIIIGPGEGRGTHTDPTPFQPNLDSNWKLWDHQEVRLSKDHIAVYIRN